jgi:ketosteroid isomerase-like protein
MKTLITLIAATCLVGTAFAQQPNQPPKPGPEYKAYDVWVGDWQYEGEAMASLLGPAGKFAGKQTARWILNGFFLEFRWEEKGPLGDIGAVELDWYDAATKSYPYQGFQNNGDMYSATGTVSGNVWKSSGNVTHQGIKYQTRGASTFAVDGMSFTWESEVSADGKTWQVFAKGKATKVTPVLADTASVEKELIQLEDGWAAALLKADVAYIDQILASDYLDTDDTGTITTKAQDLANLKSGDLKFAVFVPDDYRVHVYGDTAVVMGRNTQQAQFKGADISGQYRWTDTWAKRGGIWQCVATHVSKVPQK